MTGSLQNRGFVMMELLPALLVLLFAMLIGSRMIWIRLTLEEKARRAVLSSEALSATWLHWAGSGGRLAIAVQDRTAGWDIVDLPGEAWLPAGEGTGSNSPSGEQSIIFRRNWQQLDSRTAAWIVERLSSDSTGNPEWVWQATRVDAVLLRSSARAPSG